MSLQLNFEPHSWYRGFALRKQDIIAPPDARQYYWIGAIDNGNTYRVDELEAETLADLKQKIRDYHLRQHNGHGERIARRRLEYLRGEIRAERISYGEQAELIELADYIEPGDVELLEWSGIPEARR